MQLATPSPVAFGSSVSQVTVTSVTFDLVGHRFTLVYADPASGGVKQFSAAIPAAVQAAVESHAQAALQAAEGWATAPTVVQP